MTIADLSCSRWAVITFCGCSYLSKVPDVISTLMCCAYHVVAWSEAEKNNRKCQNPGDHVWNGTTKTYFVFCCAVCEPGIFFSRFKAKCYWSIRLLKTIDVTSHYYYTYVFWNAWRLDLSTNEWKLDKQYKTMQVLWK